MKDVILRPIKAEDLPKLAEFLAAFPEDRRSADEWLQRLTNWWLENPALPALDEWTHREVIVGFVLEEFTVIKGCTCNIPTLMLWQGQEINVINGTTWRVLPEYRKYSMDLWFAHREATVGRVYFNTTPTEDVQRLLDRMGYTNYSYAGDSYFYFRKPAALKIQLRLKILLSIYMRAVNAYIKLRFRQPDGLEFTEVTTGPIGQEADELWSRTKHLYQYTNVRDSAALKWLCYNKQLYYIKERGTLIGYFILVKDSGTTYLADVWGEGMETWFSPAIAHIITKINKEQKIILPTYLPFMEKAYRRMGLLPNPRHKSPAYLHYDKKTQQFQPEKSYLTLLQGDFGA